MLIIQKVGERAKKKKMHLYRLHIFNTSLNFSLPDDLSTFVNQYSRMKSVSQSCEELPQNKTTLSTTLTLLNHDMVFLFFSLSSTSLNSKARLFPEIKTKYITFAILVCHHTVPHSLQV